MTIGRCLECRWWEVSDLPNDAGYGCCQMAEWTTSGISVNATHCDLLDDGFLHPESLAKAVADGPEISGAQLLTRHDFGCIQWERKL